MEFTLINPINQNYSTIEQVLVNRGIQPQDIDHYLHLTKEDDLSYHDLMNVKEALRLIMEHLLREDGKIFVQVDKQHCPR